MTMFEKIKSKYILQKIFDNLPKRKSLEFFKYNKSILKSDISINTYKEYSGLYSSVELEIIPPENKSGTFINFIEDK